MTTEPLHRELCSRARLARDARFDGLFYTAVKTTGIFCRPICPATPPRECNVAYYPSALAALRAGYRPCLRCRPEAAPGSPPWRGVDTTLARAVRLIDQGEWQDQPLETFAARLGISGRYLRKLFTERLGIPPLRYLNNRRVLLAKQLLQETRLPITDVALTSGFASLRHFNTSFRQVMGKAPRDIRRAGSDTTAGGLTLFLSYRPPYNWNAMSGYLTARCVENLEVAGPDHYGRSFATNRVRGSFIATHRPERNGFAVELHLDSPGAIADVVANIRRLLDLDADMGAIDQSLGNSPGLHGIYRAGIRLPGAWSRFEAGVRAILGQQVSVRAATGLAASLVALCGQNLRSGTVARLFPQPRDVLGADLNTLPVPASRRQTLKRFAEFMADPANESRNDWQQIKGIGPWTEQYAAFRMGDPDILPMGDLGVRRALAGLGPEANPESWRPWRSYATLQLWQSLTTQP